MKQNRHYLPESVVPLLQ